MNGFLPTSRAPLMIDVIACSLLVLVPLSIWAVVLVRDRQDYRRHSRVQSGIFGTLVIAVGLFELELHLVDWRALAEPSPYFDTWLMPWLRVHLTFALTTSLIWIITVPLAWWNFGRPPRPGSHSAVHRWCGRTALLGLTLTTFTGWLFYYMAFLS